MLLRRIAFWTGVALMLAGLGAAAYVGWELYGTTWVSHRAQRHAVEDIERSWATQDPTGQPGDATGQIPGDAIGVLHIPRFGADYAMPIFQSTRNTVLRKGFGHYDGTAQAGQQGNFALAAHRRTRGEPLRHMPDLRPGDEVVVETRTATYTYVLDTDPRRLVLDFTAGWVLAPHPRNPDPQGVEPAQDSSLITLTTCADLFHSDNRMVVFGHLASTVTKP